MSVILVLLVPLLLGIFPLCMERLEARCAALVAAEDCAVVLGDYNVIPEPEDCYDVAVWREDALYLPPTRMAWRRLLHLGLTDAVRVMAPEPGVYTFWDYQAGRWPRDQGIRIDHFLLSPQAADRLVECRIDKGPRAEEKASDHTPVVLELAD